MGTVVHLEARPSAEEAWEAYVAHRLKEAMRPALADDLTHIIEAERLHALFTDAFAATKPSAVVLPFRRKG